MSYATSQDIADRYGQGVLDAIDRDGNGQPDQAAIDKALADASAEIDTYLAERYTLPLATVPDVLKRLCVEMALYRLVREGTAAAEDYRLRYEDATRLLRDIATGKAALNLPAPEAPAEHVEFSSNERRFTRDTMKEI